MEQYKIREILKDECEQCVKVIREGFGTVAEEFGLTVQNCPSNGAFIEIERLITDYEKGHLMYGLFSEEQMVGFMQLEDRGNNQYELRKVTVLPEYRHKGYGKILIDFARDKVDALGGEKITIGIIEENERLKNWYLANGFVHTGTTQFDFLPFVVGFMEMPIYK